MDPLRSVPRCCSLETRVKACTARSVHPNRLSSPLYLPYTFQRVLEEKREDIVQLKQTGNMQSDTLESISNPRQRHAENGATNRMNDAPQVSKDVSKYASKYVSQCLVRPSTPADIPAITAIYANFVTTSTATFEIVAPDEAEISRRRQAVLDHGLPYLTAELEGYIVGFCYASQFRPREGYRFTLEDSIYVRPDCIGRGVGKMLLAELISECKAKGCHSMVACICGVNVSSVALHASLGFREVGLLPEAGYKFGEWLRLLIMQCHLQ